LNQLLLLSSEAGVSEGFFSYYWLETPLHTYVVTQVGDYSSKWRGSDVIVSFEHLWWGLYRFYIDALLYFGNIRAAYRYLRDLDFKQIEEYFLEERIDTERLKQRGPYLTLKNIPMDDRYLLSEMACKSYGDEYKGEDTLHTALIEAWKTHQEGTGGRTFIRDLLNKALIPDQCRDRRPELLFSADEILNEEISSEEDINKKYDLIAKKFADSRTMALANTRYYLSMVDDLDVYVATSMRTRDDFRKMARLCSTVFENKKLKELNLRYFDPTLSAASGHEDKGLIECLMVKAARVLVYSAGAKESFGKDAEAAMALSLGKPVIFFCDSEQKSRFYRDVHPLSRLIQFDTGVAVGAMVTDDIEEVIELLRRIFHNEMKYSLDKHRVDYVRLKEKSTGSVVRIQTSDGLLRETFWNYYHRK
jgi:hypothetical protein